MSFKKGLKSIGLILLLVLVIFYTGEGKNTMNKKCKASNLDTPTDTKVVDSKSPYLVTIKGIGCNIDIGVSDTNDFSYCYDETLFNLKIKKDQGVYIIANTKKHTSPSWKDRVIINLPKDLEFSKLKIISKDAGISVCELNKPMKIINKKGAISINIPINISNDISYKSIQGSGTITFGRQNEFVERSADAKIKETAQQAGYTFRLIQESSSISLPVEFGDYEAGTASYQYVSGSGLANINVDLTSSSLSVKSE